LEGSKFVNIKVQEGVNKTSSNSPRSLKFHNHGYNLEDISNQDLFEVIPDYYRAINYNRLNQSLRLIKIIGAIKK